MRIMVLFDLPTKTVENRKEYLKFRKFLLNEGFIMMQESVYTKLVLNGSSAKLVRDKVKKNAPVDGLVEMLTITEKQFSGIEYIVGRKSDFVLDTDERLILKIFSFENDIDFSKNHINVLQIQNKKLFAKMVSSFNNMCKGLSVECDEVITLLEQDEIVDFTKNVLFVVDFLNFDFNQRRIQTVLYQYIDKIIKLEPEILSNINNLQDSIHIEFMSIMEEFPFEILCKKDSSILDILKMYGIRIKANVDEKIIEKLFKLVELVQCLDLAKLIILVNVKQYLDSDEIVEFYKYCVYNNVKLLVLERGLEVSPLERERILFVDENFDEFFIQ